MPPAGAQNLSCATKKNNRCFHCTLVVLYVDLCISEESLLSEIIFSPFLAGGDIDGYPAVSR